MLYYQVHITDATHMYAGLFLTKDDSMKEQKYDPTKDSRMCQNGQKDPEFGKNA
jgi:hypothetical protein